MLYRSALRGGLRLQGPQDLWYSVSGTALGAADAGPCECPVCVGDPTRLTYVENGTQPFRPARFRPPADAAYPPNAIEQNYSSSGASAAGDALLIACETG